MSELPSLYGGITSRRVRTTDLQRAKERGEGEETRRRAARR